MRMRVSVYSFARMFESNLNFIGLSALFNNNQADENWSTFLLQAIRKWYGNFDIALYTDEMRAYLWNHERYRLPQWMV